MADNLVIIESPVKAKTIGKFLGKKYDVHASVGHLRDLPVSKFAIDIENDFQPQYINIRGKGDIIKELKKLAKGASKIFLATDPDREGEAIAWHLATILSSESSKICRVTFNEITKKAVTEAFKVPRSIDNDLVDAYQARRVLDRIVGYKISPILWSKVRKGLSAGRCQSVAVRLVCDREDEIEAFEPQEYWNILAELNKLTDKLPIPKNMIFTSRFYGDENGKINLKNKDDAYKIYNKVSDGEYTVKNIKKSEKKKSPAPPFITSSLQQEAARKLGFTVVKTMSVVQSLYEGVNVGGGNVTGLVTYIRTDSMRISEEAQDAATDYIEKTYGRDYLPATKRIYKNKNAAQDAHEAIRPSHIDMHPEDIRTKLTSEQYRLYKLIYDRFIASQMTDAVYDVVNVDVDCGGYIFKSSGSTVKFAGFTKVYEEAGDEKRSDDAESDNVRLPVLSEGEKLHLIKCEPSQHFTAPPARYTEATLGKALEEYGIGRPSTFAAIISVIQQRSYVLRDKKALYPSELGKIVNELMKKSFPDIVNIEFTANVENDLDKIEQGGIDWVSVIRNFYSGFEAELVKAEEELEHIEVADAVSDVPCDKCGRMMVIKKGKYGDFLACPGYPECKNTKNIVEEVGALCPLCGKPLIFRRSKAGKKYISCSGYPDCKFMSWNIPTTENCPDCGAYLEIANTKIGRLLKCSNSECKYSRRYKESKKTGEES